MTEYCHVLEEEGEEVVIGGGSYKGCENILRFQGRDLLCVVGGTSALRTCCGGTCGTGFITVPGFVTRWQHRTTEAGVPVSEVEPVVSDDMRADIRSILEQIYGIRNIRFL